MAICFVKAKVIGRSGGQSAVAAAAYRSGLKLTDERTGDIHDYRKKQGVDYSDIITPIDAIGANDWLIDRSKLWNKVEASEIRYDAQLSREMIIAIPRELDRNAMINLVREHVQASYVDRGMIADINLHHLDSDNPHAHVMLIMRELTIDDQGSVSFGKKNRSWNDKKLVQTQKREWETLANQYLDRAGVETRIDSRSYEKQGVNKIPQIHVGSASSRLEKRGIKTQRGNHNREVAIANQEIANTQADINQTQQILDYLAEEFAKEAERREAQKVAKSLPTVCKGFDGNDIFSRIEKIISASTPTPIINTADKYYPTRAEVYGWWINPDFTDFKGEIEALGVRLKSDYMLQDHMIGFAVPNKLPDNYQSINVWISPADKARFDRIKTEVEIAIPTLTQENLAETQYRSQLALISAKFNRLKATLLSDAKAEIAKLEALPRWHVFNAKGIKDKDREIERRRIKDRFNHRLTEIESVYKSRKLLLEIDKQKIVTDNNPESSINIIIKDSPELINVVEINRQQLEIEAMQKKAQEQQLEIKKLDSKSKLSKKFIKEI